MKQIVILTLSLFATTAAFAATSDTNDDPTKTNTTNTTEKKGGESEAKVQEAHKKVSLMNLAAFSLQKDTLSTISPFGNMDRFRKATADYSEFRKNN